MNIKVSVKYVPCTAIVAKNAPGFRRWLRKRRSDVGCEKKPCKRKKHTHPAAAGRQAALGPAEAARTMTATAVVVIRVGNTWADINIPSYIVGCWLKGFLGSHSRDRGNNWRRLYITNGLLSRIKYGNRGIWCGPRVVPVLL